MDFKRNIWLQRVLTLAVCVCVLVIAGLALSPLQRKAWGDVRSLQPELNLKGVEGALGQGLVVGLLGGFRTIIADMVFIRANVYWEKKDRAKTEALINLTTSIDPRPMFFWVNGARIMAYDIPIWRIREAGGLDTVPKSIQTQIYQEQAQRGLDLMDKAAEYFPGNHKIPLEKAQIYNNKLNDKEKAAEYFLKAYETEGGPYFAARIHAELLRQLDRKEEAYNFYRKLYAELPDDDPMANKPVILERIRELEKELDTPALQRLPAQPQEKFLPGYMQEDLPVGVQNPIGTQQVPPGEIINNDPHAGHNH
ncbi:MAG: tetratricopeptide repeat protein [Puniceicoccales bacterium]